MRTILLLCWLAPAPPFQLAAMALLTWRRLREAEESAQGERQTGASEPAAEPKAQQTPAPQRKRQRRARVEAMPSPGPLAIPAEPKRGTGTYGYTGGRREPLSGRHELSGHACTGLPFLLRRHGLLDLWERPA